MKITIEHLKVAIVSMWFTMLIIPAFILLARMTQYLWNNTFHEWHIMILWALSLPITTAIIMISKLKEPKEIKK